MHNQFSITCLIKQQPLEVIFLPQKKKIETQVCPQEFMQYTDGVNLNLNERDSSKYVFENNLSRWEKKKGKYEIRNKKDEDKLKDKKTSV